MAVFGVIVNGITRQLTLTVSSISVVDMSVSLVVVVVVKVAAAQTLSKPPRVVEDSLLLCLAPRLLMLALQRP